MRDPYGPGLVLLLTDDVHMLEIFRRNRFFNSLLLLPYTILVRIWVVFADLDQPFHSKGILGDWIFDDLNIGGPVATFLSIALVYFQALMLNRIVIRNRLTYEMTLFPGLFYIILMSFFPEYNVLSAPLVANTFMIIALDHLFSSGKKTGSASRTFAGGFWLSVAFLFYFGDLIMILFGAISLSVFRTVKWREWLQYLVGYLAPVWISGLLDYLLHDNLRQLSGHFTSNAGFLSFDLNAGLPVYLQSFVFGALIVVSLFNYSSMIQKSNIQVKKKLGLLNWIVFLSMCVVFVQSGINYEEWTLLTIPLACFTAILCIRSRQLLLLEIFHFIVLLSMLGMQIANVLID